MTYDFLDDAMLAPNPISDATIIGDGVSVDQYLSQPEGAKRGSPGYVISGSDLMEFANCPSRWLRGYAEDDTPSTAWGSLLDAFLMDPARVGDRYLLLPATYVNDDRETKPWNWNANICKAWRKKNNPTGAREEVKHELFFAAKGAAELILADPQLRELFECSRKQVMLTGIYADKETGVRVPVKALLDLVPNGVGYLADLKTTNNAHPRAWKKHVFNFNYHVQGSRHLDLWNAASGEQRNEFRHVLQESVHPFEVGKRFLSSEFLALGRQRYLQALRRYAQAIATGVWETYDQCGDPNDMVIDGWLITSPESWMIGA